MTQHPAGEARIIKMPTNTYTDEFRRRAVELYESTPDATLKAIADDLGISRGTLKTWVIKYGSGQLRTTSSSLGAAPPVVRSEPQAARVARLEAENHALRVESRKLAEERDILRQAAKYFAGETNW